MNVTGLTTTRLVDLNIPIESCLNRFIPEVCPLCEIYCLRDGIYRDGVRFIYKSIINQKQQEICQFCYTQLKLIQLNERHKILIVKEKII